MYFLVIGWGNWSIRILLFIVQRETTLNEQRNSKRTMAQHIANNIAQRIKDMGRSKPRGQRVRGEKCVAALSKCLSPLQRNYIVSNGALHTPFNSALLKERLNPSIAALRAIQVKSWRLSSVSDCVLEGLAEYQKVS